MMRQVNTPIAWQLMRVEKTLIILTTNTTKKAMLGLIIARMVCIVTDVINSSMFLTQAIYSRTQIPTVITILKKANLKVITTNTNANNAKNY